MVRRQSQGGGEAGLWSNIQGRYLASRGLRPSALCVFMDYIRNRKQRPKIG